MRERYNNIKAQVRWVIEEYRLARLAGLFTFLLCIWFLAAVCIWLSERAGAQRTSVPPDEKFRTLPRCLWCSTVYLVSGLEEFEPQTTGARAAAVVVMVVGVGVLGLTGAQLLATFVDRARQVAHIRRKPSCMFRDHIVICGWNGKGHAVLAELRSPQFRRQRHIVIVSPDVPSILVEDRRLNRRLWGISEDPVLDDALRDANVDRCHSVIILAPPEQEQRADAQGVLISLALNSVHSGTPACVEVVDSRNTPYFQRTPAREPINVRGIAGKLIAHTAQKHDLTDFFMRLLTVSVDTNETYIVDVPPALHGASFTATQKALLDWPHQDLTLVGVSRALEAEDRAMVINPPRNRGGQGAGGRRQEAGEGTGNGEQGTGSPEGVIQRETCLQPGDKLVIIARSMPELAKLPVRG